MSNGIIPIDVWLGVFNLVVNEQKPIKRSFLAGECFKVLGIGIPKEITKSDFDPNIFLLGTELVLGINNILNTDIPCWPEGWAEDFSNLKLNFDTNLQKYNFVIEIHKDDIEDPEYVTAIINGVQKVNDVVSYVIEPRFDSFIDNTKPTFMNLLTMEIEQSMALAAGNSLVCKRDDNAPVFRITKVDLDKETAIAPLLVHQNDLPEIYKTAVIRYINLISNDLFHEDMVEKIIRITMQELTTNENQIVISFEIFGQTYLVTAIFVPGYQLPEEEVVDETI